MLTSGGRNVAACLFVSSARRDENVYQAARGHDHAARSLAGEPHDGCEQAPKHDADPQEAHYHGTKRASRYAYLVAHCALTPHCRTHGTTVLAPSCHTRVASIPTQARDPASGRATNPRLAGASAAEQAATAARRQFRSTRGLSGAWCCRHFGRCWARARHGCKRCDGDCWHNCNQPTTWWSAAISSGICRNGASRTTTG